MSAEYRTCSSSAEADDLPMGKTAPLTILFSHKNARGYIRCAVEDQISWMESPMYGDVLLVVCRAPLALEVTKKIIRGVAARWRHRDFQITCELLDTPSCISHTAIRASRTKDVVVCPIVNQPYLIHASEQILQSHSGMIGFLRSVGVAGIVVRVPDAAEITFETVWIVAVRVPLVPHTRDTMKPIDEPLSRDIFGLVPLGKSEVSPIMIARF